MTAQSRKKSEPIIPLSTVFFTIGFIIMLTVLIIWVLVPRTMPQPVYDLVGDYLPRDLPQLLQVASVPQNNDGTILLPETPLDPNDPNADVRTVPAQPNLAKSGVPTRIMAPSIGLDAPIADVGLHIIRSDGDTYYQWQVPSAQQAGWHNTSAPLGSEGNTVINGHHNVYGEVFRDINQLKEGDQLILLDDNNDSYLYRVTEQHVLEERGQPLDVRLDNAQWIEPTNDERITLVTCWPYTDNSHRVVIVAEPININQ